MDELKKYILSELKKINSSRENLVAQLNALSGAEEAFQNMLKELEKEEGENDKD